MAPEKAVKAFTVKVIDGPSPIVFVKFIIACQEDSMNGHDRMFFTLKGDSMIPPRIEVQVTGVFKNVLGYEGFKIFGIIRKIRNKKIAHARITEIIREKEHILNTGLEEGIVIAYDSRRRQGRVYGPLSALLTPNLLCYIISAGIVDTYLIQDKRNLDIIS